MPLSCLRIVELGTGSTLTYSIAGGPDAALFTIDPTTGNLTFKSAPDYEHPSDASADNIYNVTVQVSDGIHTDSQSLTVNVINVQDEAPTDATLSLVALYLEPAFLRALRLFFVAHATLVG